MSIYDTLNEKQKEAVLQTEGPVLILAGAGAYPQDRPSDRGMSGQPMEHHGDHLYQ